ncbi:SDR family NAD(P)-dependent oxidoreductase [Salinibacterium sp. NK8237]|uniref:SDR family NAD(P)-dependent oxidoreductase n=1 Tax=Salinibacterium sp. NK8237 TaxID=2792038 RepID=UPI0018CCAE4C|nr:SDR family NAD(P)-dependent oxidoreductase [Salinibacterium sp. NK8237]MBH0130927.1 SDR family oxidoreductase [Salinibacterium sp. NK8237]
MDKDLEGRVSLVTGAARGIGRAIARTLAERGSHVMLVDVTDGAEAVEEISAATNGDVRVASAIVDVRDRAQVRACVDSVVEQFGSLDILVNNAGTCGRVDLETMDDETWERDIETNLRGTFLFTQAAIYPYMKEQAFGRIINISSISGIMGGPFASGDGSNRSGPAYAASKGGIIAFTKWVAKEVGVLGITSNTVAPGPISTPMTESTNYSLDTHAIKRMGTPEDIATAVAYLASPSSGFVTGDTLKVDGGTAIG